MMNNNKEKMWLWVLYISSMILVIVSALGGILQFFFRVRPLCEGCREIGCGFCELEFAVLTFIEWIIGLVLFIFWAVTINNKKWLNFKTTSVSAEKIALVIGILMSCLYIIPLFASLVPMFLPPVTS